jgi:hypothetical protein
MDSEQVKELFAKSVLAFTFERFALEAVHGILTRPEMHSQRQLLLERLSSTQRPEAEPTVRRNVVYDGEIVALEMTGVEWVI